MSAVKRPESETQIRNAILRWVTLHGGLVFIHDSVGIWDPGKKCFRRRHARYRMLGVSDLVGIWQTKFLAIEVKSATGRLTVEQERFLMEVNRRGGIGFMARSIHEVQENFMRRGLFEPSRR